MSWKKLRNIINREAINSEEEFPGVKCFESGLAFLDTNRECDDWFLQIETFDPHEPFHAPERFRKSVRNDPDAKVLDWPTYEKVTESAEGIETIRANYAALVAMCDEYFGRILDYFDEHDMWKDTCLIMATDHGFLLSEHDWWGKNRMPYYEEISHIPLMIWHPEHADQAGTRRRGLTQTTDLMPTILDIFDIAVPPETTGKSLMPLIAQNLPQREYCVFGMFGGPIGIVDGRYAYYHYPRNDVGEGLFEYTLAPSHMTAPFSAKEFEGLQLSDAFDFTKGMQLMKIKARSDADRAPGQDGTGLVDTVSVLFDLDNDPKQEIPLDDDEIKARLCAAISDELRLHEAPSEIFEHFELTNKRPG